MRLSSTLVVAATALLSAALTPAAADAQRRQSARERDQAAALLYSKPRLLTADERLAGERMVVETGAAMKDELRDPDSARFRSVRIRTNNFEGSIRMQVIGQVNSRNAYGGYAGWECFSYSGGRLSIHSIYCPGPNGWIDDRDYTADLTKAAGLTVEPAATTSTTQ